MGGGEDYISIVFINVDLHNIYIYIYLKDPWTLQWMGLNLYSRGWVLKITSFEGLGYLIRVYNIRQIPLLNSLSWNLEKKNLSCNSL